MVALNSCVFRSLDFPNRVSVTAREIAERLRVSAKHVVHLIEAGLLIEEPSRLGTGSRSLARVEVSSYRQFIIRRTIRDGDFVPADPLPYASLDFSSDRPLTRADVASKLSMDERHVLAFIETRELNAIDLRGPNSPRGTWRIPIEAYRHFMRSRIRSTAGMRS